LLVDGGLRSNYPLWIFNKERRQQGGMLIPIVGFRFTQQEPAEVRNHSLLEDYLLGLVNAALEGASWLQGPSTKSVVEVPILIPAYVRATSFDLDERRSDGSLAGSATLAGVLEERPGRPIIVFAVGQRERSDPRASAERGTARHHNSYRTAFGGPWQARCLNTNIGRSGA
jgi:hypothetical protein